MLKKYVFSIALLGLLFVVPQAQAISLGKTRVVARVPVSEVAEELTSIPKDKASYRIYNCKPGICKFWIKGTANCIGIVRVIETPKFYNTWFTQMKCN